MSDLSDDIKDLIDREKKSRELRTLKDAVSKHEAENKLKRIYEGRQLERDLADADLETDWGLLAERARRKVAQRENSTSFLFDELDGTIQLAAGSLVSICAATGTGKSTLTANAAKNYLDKGKRAFIIVNEEESEDVGIRIACLDLGVSIHKYKSKNGMSQAEKDRVINRMAEICDGSIYICGLDFKNNSKIVTSPEGMNKILNLAKEHKFDVVIIDYYQNVNTSITNPGMKPYEAQELFANDLDYFKNEIGCPIIIMAQIRPGDAPYKERFEGRRLLLNKCTDIFEVKTDKEYSRSAIIIHKDRWLGNQGEEVFIGYKGGAYVPYTQAFEQSVVQMKLNIAETKLTPEDDDFNIDAILESKVGPQTAKIIQEFKEQSGNTEDV